MKNTDIIVDGTKIAQVEVLEIGKEKYFQMKIIFPDGSWRVIYPSYASLNPGQDWTERVREQIRRSK